MLCRKLPPPDVEDAAKVDLTSEEYNEMITESPFLYLTCDLPPTPLFTDEFRENIIPQVCVFLTNIKVVIDNLYHLIKVRTCLQLPYTDAKGKHRDGTEWLMCETR